jgi:hypothetical protein
MLSLVTTMENVELFVVHIATTSLHQLKDYSGQAAPVKQTLVTLKFAPLLIKPSLNALMGKLLTAKPRVGRRFVLRKMAKKPQRRFFRLAPNTILKM